MKNNVIPFKAFSNKGSQRGHKILEIFLIRPTFLKSIQEYAWRFFLRKAKNSKQSCTGFPKSATVTKY